MPGTIGTTSGPPGSMVAITPDDDTEYKPPLRGIRNGGAAAVTVVVDLRDNGEDIALHNVQPGETLVGYFLRVKETTTATDLVGMY